MTPIPPKREPTADDKAHPKYFKFHQYIGHPTIECYSVRKIYYDKVASGEIGISSVLTKPLPAHDKGKEACNMIRGFERVIEEFQAIAQPRNKEEVDPRRQVKALMNSLKFKRFYVQLRLSEQTRIETTKAIMDILEK